MRLLDSLLNAVLFTFALVALAACTTAAAGDPETLSAPLPTPPPSTPSRTATPFTAVTPIPTNLPPPTPSPTATPLPSPTAITCLVAGGRIERHTLSTDSSSWPWEFRVYLPPCYDQEPERRYPVLTLIHGSTFNDDQWDRLGADETADRLIAAGEIEPLIILMPRDRRWVEPTEDPFGQTVVDDILPWLAENYRTRTDREWQAIGGLSRGAAWAVHLGLLHWERFGAIGGHSLPVFWTDTAKIRGWLQDIPSDQLPRIYLDIGENDYLIESAAWFEAVLNELNIPHEWYLFPGRHEEVYWESHLEAYLRWYTLPWNGP